MSILQLQWVMNIYTLVFSVFLITSGRIADIYGKRRLFYAGTILFVVSTLFAGLSTHIIMLILCRGLQSLGGSLIVTAGLALLSVLFSGDEHGKAVGIYMGVIGIGLTLGPFVGGVVTSLLSWRWVFFTIIPFIIVGLLICFKYLESSKKTKKNTSIDYKGFILLTIAVGSLVYAIIQGEQSGWMNIKTIGFFMASIITTPLLLYVEQRVDDPMLDLTIFKSKEVVQSMLICTGAGVVIGTLLFFNPLYLSIIHAMPAKHIGLILMAIPMMQVVISLLFNNIYHHFSIATLCVFAIACALLATLLQYVFSFNTSYFLIVISYLLSGVAWGFANATAPCAVKQGISQEKTAATLGAIYTTWNISSAVLLAVATVIFNAKEKITMKFYLSKQNVHLTQAQHAAIKSSLSDPAHAKELLSHFFGRASGKVFDFYRHSFLSGFHAMILAMSMILIALLVISIISSQEN